jgi:hypothetical protein
MLPLALLWAPPLSPPYLGATRSSIFSIRNRFRGAGGGSAAGEFSGFGRSFV